MRSTTARVPSIPVALRLPGATSKLEVASGEAANDAQAQSNTRAMQGLALPICSGFLLMLFAGWLQRQQAGVSEYLKVENRMLREQLLGRRITVADARRRLLAERQGASSPMTCSIRRQ